MFNSKEKERIERELELYKKEKQLEIDANIQERKVNNWQTVDDARRESYEQRLKIESELAQLKASKESIAKEVELLTNENKWLKELVSQFAKNQVVIKP